MSVNFVWRQLNVTYHRSSNEARFHWCHMRIQINFRVKIRNNSWIWLKGHKLRLQKLSFELDKNSLRWFDFLEQQSFAVNYIVARIGNSKHARSFDIGIFRNILTNKAVAIEVICYWRDWQLQWSNFFIGPKLLRRTSINQSEQVTTYLQLFPAENLSKL